MNKLTAAMLTRYTNQQMQVSFDLIKQQDVASGLSIWLSDQEIFLEKLKANDPEAFKLLYKKYSAALLGIVLKSINDMNKAEYILEKVFLDVWSSINTYDEKRFQIFTWLNQITVNQISLHQAYTMS